MLSSVIILPGRPGFGALLWWFQGPDSSPGSYSFELDGKILTMTPLLLNVSKELNITDDTAGKVAARTFLVVTAHTDGASGKPHQLRVFYQGKASNIAYSRTLPNSPDELNMVLASCYYAGNTYLLAGAPMPKEFMSHDGIPHVKMLCGDQIYIDLSLGGMYPHSLGNPWKSYEDQWYEPRFLAWMAHGGNLCMADDHEFWNNFPSEKRASVISGLFSKPSQAIGREMEQAFLIYQAVLNANPDDLLAKQPLIRDHLHCFEFPGLYAPATFSKHFSMLVLDTRTRRSALDVNAANYQFTDPLWLSVITQQLAKRDGPTLLATPQSLLERGGGGESNLADYKDQFSLLWEAVWNCKHQVLLLTGDIHWSRAQTFKSATTKITHYEIVSSALSRIALGTSKLQGLNSTVRWGGQTASAMRIADSYAEHNYAILQFSTHDQKLRCVVRWWEINGNGQHIPLNMAAGLWEDLKVATNFAKPMMDITLDLS